MHTCRSPSRSQVSRSLAACEGALLVVDASQGVEAQTIANAYLAKELSIVPVLNKIDLPGADVLAASEEIESTLGIDCSDAIPASAKVAAMCMGAGMSMYMGGCMIAVMSIGRVTLQGIRFYLYMSM